MIALLVLAAGMCAGSAGVQFVTGNLSAAIVQMFTAIVLGNFIAHHTET